MSVKLCVMCELASTVDVLPVGKSLHKFGLLSSDIYHDLNKASVNESIKWRCLLHSINFKESTLARLSLIELVRIGNAKLADALEKAFLQDQIGCVCGLRASGPRLKRSNSLTNMTDSIKHEDQSSFKFGYFKFTDDAFSGHEKMKYMSLQVHAPPAQRPSEFRRRSRSLEILRPFIPLNREVYVPKEQSDSDSEPDMDDEIDLMFSGIAETVTNTENNPDLNENTSGGMYNYPPDETDMGRARMTQNTQTYVIPSSIDDDHFKVPCGFEQEVDPVTMENIPNDGVSRTSGNGARQVGTSDSKRVRWTSQDPELDSWNDEALFSMREVQVSQPGKGQRSPSDATDWRIVAAVIVIIVIIVICTVYLVPTDLLCAILMYVALEMYTRRRRPRPSRR